MRRPFCLFFNVAQQNLYCMRMALIDPIQGQPNITWRIGRTSAADERNEPHAGIASQQRAFVDASAADSGLYRQRQRTKIRHRSGKFCDLRIVVNGHSGLQFRLDGGLKFLRIDQAKFQIGEEMLNFFVIHRRHHGVGMIGGHGQAHFLPAQHDAAQLLGTRHHVIQAEQKIHISFHQLGIGRSEVQFVKLDLYLRDLPAQFSDGMAQLLIQRQRLHHTDTQAVGAVGNRTFHQRFRLAMGAIKVFQHREQFRSYGRQAHRIVAPSKERGMYLFLQRLNVTAESGLGKI